MKKKFSALLLLLASLSGSAQAGPQNHTNEELLAPSLYGSNGGLRLISAQRAYGDDMSIQFGMHGQYFALDNFFTANDDTSRLGAQFSVNFAPCPLFEVFASWMAFTSTDDNNAALIQQFGNVNFGAKAGWDFTNVFSAAVVFQTEYLNDVGDLNVTDKAWNFLPMLALTFDLTRMQDAWPFRIHANAGYRFDQSQDIVANSTATAEQRFLLRVYPEDHILAGLGIELPADFVNFIVEYSTEQIIESGYGGYLDNPQRVTLGAKIFPTKGRQISLDAGFDVAIFNDDPSNVAVAEPDYNIIFGLTYNHLPHKPVVKSATPATGGMAGIILEETTLKPLGGVIISFPEIELTRLQSHPQNGTFGFNGIAPGTIKARAELDGYESADFDVTVVSGTTATPEVRLKKKLQVKKGTLHLKLTDADNKPLVGQMAFAEHPNMTPLAVTNKGLLAKLEADTYKIVVSSEGYESEEHTITIEPDGKLVTEYRLREKSSTVRLEQNKIVIEDKVPFKTGKWDLQPTAYGVLNRVADLIIDSPQISKLRIEGHTDNKGNETHNIYLSQKRAEAVLDYLVKRGVDRNRLEAIGYGPSKPLQTNDTVEGRSANRRVEFTVTQGQ